MAARAVDLEQLLAANEVGATVGKFYFGFCIRRDGGDGEP
jgi:hypothetical protein